MNLTFVIVVLYLAICCLCASLYAETAVAAFKPFGFICGTLMFIITFLIGPIVLVFGLFKAIIDAAKKKKKPKAKKQPRDKETFILALIRDRLGLKEGEFFRFDNQNHDDIYYFSKTALKKIQWGHVRESNVSLNWILSRECKITKLTPNDVRAYLNIYPRAAGEKVE